MDRWLREHAGPYDERDRVCADVVAALARFPTLRPKSDVYSQSRLFSAHPSLIPPQRTTMAAPSFSSVSTASFPSHSGARPTTSPSQSGSQSTTLATPRSPMSSPHPTSSSAPAPTSISAVAAQSDTSTTGPGSTRSVPSPNPHRYSPCPSPAISPPSSKQCKTTSPVPPLFTPNPSPTAPLQPRSPSPPPPLPCRAHNPAKMIPHHCLRNPPHLRRPPCPHALSLPPPSLIHMYVHLTINALVHDSLSSLCTIGPRRPSPTSHVQMFDPPSITNQYLPRACIATESLCDQPSNSLENHPPPPVLITVHQYPRTHFQPHPCQLHNPRQPMFHPPP